ncbi:DUF262 domain-containing protein [Rhodococcus sp. 24CO]|uniref:DUF262 domain-containing protein n=1 Tax=Rhodococcus sp. 24CO TaxID=3117460 RepID=UPI003D352093
MQEDIDAPISVTKTVYTVTDFLEWQRAGGLNLRPYFQRGDVWTPKAKSYLIDTLIRGYPVPIIYLQNKQDRRTISNVRHVVDGQQRLRTILAYVAPEVLDNITDRDQFTILKSHNKALAGMTFRDLPPEIQERITDTELSVHVLPANLSDRHLLQLFARLNSTGERLNDQELRNAEFHGEFKTIAYMLSYDQIDRWQQWGTFNPRYLAQMRDAELTSELMIAALLGIQAKNKTAIDGIYRKYDDSFQEANEVIRRVRTGFTFLDNLFGRFYGHRDLKKITTQSWVYTFFVAFDLCEHGRPILSSKDDHPSYFSFDFTVGHLVHKAEHLLEVLSTGTAPDNLAKALRGASTDTRSRLTRLEFLLEM